MTDKTKESSGSNETSSAYQAALRLLAHRPHSQHEIRQRLTWRFSTVAVQQAITLLQKWDYLNDATFARLWRESREIHRPRSATLIRRELQQRGVARDLADAATTGLDDDDSAYRAGHHRIRALKGVDQVIFQRRLGDYLRRRGFSREVTLRAVERLRRERDMG